MCPCVSCVSEPYRRVGAFLSRHRFKRRVRLHSVVEIFPPPVKTIRNPSLKLMGWRVLFKYRRGGSCSRWKRYVLFSLSSEPKSISVPQVIVNAFQSLSFIWFLYTKFRLLSIWSFHWNWYICNLHVSPSSFNFSVCY